MPHLRGHSITWQPGTSPSKIRGYQDLSVNHVTEMSVPTWVFPVTYGDHLPLRRHESWPVAETQLCLQGVEVDLKLAFLLDTGRLVHTAVVPKVLQLALHGTHALLWHAVLQPWDGAANPFQELPGRKIKGLKSVLAHIIATL